MTPIRSLCVPVVVPPSSSPVPGSRPPPPAAYSLLNTSTGSTFVALLAGA